LRGAVVYDYASPDAVNQTVWLIPGQQTKDVMVTDGVFGLPGRAPGNGFPGTFEYRAEKAVRRW